MTTIFSRSPHPARRAGLLLALGAAVLAFVLYGPHAATPLAEAEAAVAPAAVAAPRPPLPEVTEVALEVTRHDTLGALFERAGVGPRQLQALLDSGDAAAPLRTLHPGQRLRVRVREDRLAGVVYSPDPLRTWIVEWRDGAYAGRWETRDYERRVATGQIAIDNSLYASAQAAGFSERVILQLAELFGWDIDFALDIRRGDQVAVVYEELWLDGQRVRDGDILAARIINAGRTHDALRYVRADGSPDYFDRDGRSMRKQFLRTPVDFRRISSRFKTERWHPVLGVKRPHRGVDYAAAPGTPVRATGDGKVIHVGAQGGYGRTVIVRHGQNTETLYAHLQGYARGLAAGKAVRQGEVIGFVGRSGTATGPHLHYEFRIAGVHRNPLTVRLPDAAPLAAAERPHFDDYAGRMFVQIERLMDDARLARTPGAMRTAG